MESDDYLNNGWEQAKDFLRKSRQPCFVLEGKKVIRAVNLMVWAKFMEQPPANRVVARDKTPKGILSTIFMGLDHNFADPGNPPLLFESVLIRKPRNRLIERYSTYEQAEQGHQIILEALTKEDK